jgi:hypothetical protein
MGGSGVYDPYRPDNSSGGEVQSERDCTRVRFSTILQQPVDAPEHSTDTVFELVPVMTGAATVIATVDDNGRIVGTVVEELADLLPCIRSGVAYVAEVTKCINGIHTVAIRPSDRATVTGAVFSINGVARPTIGLLSLNPDLTDIGAEIVVDSECLRRSEVCELRSLLRVGMQFDATVGADGTVVVSQR